MCGRALQLSPSCPRTVAMVSGMHFERMAAKYATARPPYPSSLYEALEAEGAIGPETRVLEIGAGAGLATRELVRSGSSVVAVEPGPDRPDLPHLQKEVDAVAGRGGDPTFWLLGVKNRAEVFVVPEIRRALDSFHLDGRKPLLRHPIAKELRGPGIPRGSSRRRARPLPGRRERAVRSQANVRHARGRYQQPSSVGPFTSRRFQNSLQR